jgi:hypothetical protein
MQVWATMKVSGVSWCLWIVQCCWPAYGQHLPKLASRAPDVEAQPVITSAGLNTASLAPAHSYATRAVALERLPSADGFLLRDRGFEEAAFLHSPDTVCTEPFLAIARPEAYSSNVFDHLDFSAAAIKSAFTHENLVKMGRNFVPGQPLPDAPSYVPLTTRQKFDRFLHYSHSGGFAFDVLSDSLYSQATGAYPRFGGGMEGYGKRLGASVAGAEAGAFFGGFLFPTLLHQDPRYFPSRQYDISQRLAYAASRVIIGRSDSGRNVFNSSLILSQFVQSALSNAYIPYRNETVPGTIENALANLGGIAEWNILTEFWPDIKTFFSRHEPKLLRRGPPAPNSNSFNQVAQK